MLHETEIARHAEEFGLFAFELDTDAAGRLGAMPVIYIPQPVGDGKSRYFDELGLHVIDHLSDIQQVFKFLADLGGTASGTRNGRWIVQRALDRPRLELEAGLLNDLILNLRNQVKFANLAATIKGIASLFYQADNDYALLPHLECSRQREWRIAGDLIGDSGRNSRPLTDAEATGVVKANPKFFNGIVPRTNGHHRRIELCQVLQPSASASRMADASKPHPCPASFAPNSEEGAVDGSVQTEEALCRSDRLEALHLPLPSSHDLMRILCAIVRHQPLVMMCAQTRIAKG